MQPTSSLCKTVTVTPKPQGPTSSKNQLNSIPFGDFRARIASAQIYQGTQRNDPFSDETSPRRVIAPDVTVHSVTSTHSAENRLGSTISHRENIAISRNRNRYVRQGFIDAASHSQIEITFDSDCRFRAAARVTPSKDVRIGGSALMLGQTRFATGAQCRPWPSALST